MKIGFDGVAKATHEAARWEFEEVETKSSQAFEELDEILTSKYCYVFCQGNKTITSDDDDNAVTFGIPFPDWFFNPAKMFVENAIYLSSLFDLYNPYATKLYDEQAYKNLAASLKGKLYPVLQKVENRLKTAKEKEDLNLQADEVFNKLMRDSLFGANFEKQEAQKFKGETLLFTLLKIDAENVLKYLQESELWEYFNGDEEEEAEKLIQQSQSFAFFNIIN